MRNSARDQELKVALTNGAPPSQNRSMELAETYSKFSEQQTKIEGLMTVESALLSSFESECRSALGQQFSKLGRKAKVLLQNINDIKRMIWNLLNSDCVSFYSHLADLRTFETYTSTNGDIHDFSIFKMCDNDTNKLIVTLAKLAKDRIFKIVPRMTPCYSEE